jgi:hypothetical protein
MPQTAEFYDAESAQLVTGKVLEGSPDAGGSELRPGAFPGARIPGLRVLCGNKAHEAQTAASCLLQPQSGDTVLLACLEDGTHVVLAVLFRVGEARLRLPERSTLECAGGLTVRCADSLDLQSGRTMRLHTEDLGVAAKACDLRVLSLKTLADTVDMCCGTLSSYGKHALSVFSSLTQCLGSSRRVVEGEDETRAGGSTLIVEENAVVMSKNKLSLAEETARTDAKLIQLG